MHSYINLIYRSSRVFSPRAILQWRGVKTEIKEVHLFPGKLEDTSTHKNFVIVLPEKLSETPETNEILRIPKMGDKDLNFDKITSELAFKGISSRLIDFDNFIESFNAKDDPTNDGSLSVSEFIKQVEEYLIPLDVSANILKTLKFVKMSEFNSPGFNIVMERYYRTRDKRFLENFRTVLATFYSDLNSLTEKEKAVLKIYVQENPDSEKFFDHMHFYTYNEGKRLMREDGEKFVKNANHARALFGYTVDDPDILQSVSSRFYSHESQNHHQERTPLKVTFDIYDKFMEVCPDRFVRKMLWESKIKLNSSKGPNQLKNYPLILHILQGRRKQARRLGYINFLDQKLARCMPESKQALVDNFTELNKSLVPELKNRLQELYDYACDNEFDDPDRVGLQEYDVDYWAHKYKYDVILGMSEREVKSFFPIESVLNGVVSYYRKYFDLDLKLPPDEEILSHKGLYNIKVFKKGDLLGTIIHDPLKRLDKYPVNISSRIVVQDKNWNNPSVSSLLTHYLIDGKAGKVLLTFEDIENLFFGFTMIIQQMLHKYDFYELNFEGALEVDAQLTLPYLTLIHLYKDHRVLQQCSQRKTSKGIKNLDFELIDRILRASRYFRCLKIGKISTNLTSK